MEPTITQRILAKFPGYSIVAGPYNVEQPMLPNMAAQQQKQAAAELVTQRKTDPDAKLVKVGRRAWIIRQKALKKTNQNSIVTSGAFQIKAGRGGWK